MRTGGREPERKGAGGKSRGVEKRDSEGGGNFPVSRGSFPENTKEKRPLLAGKS